MAPSGMNRQAYAFVVVQDKKMMNTISKLNASIMQADTDPFYHADCVIIVFGKKMCVHMFTMVLWLWRI